MQGKGMLVEVMLFYRNINKYPEVNGKSREGISVWDMFFLYFLEDREETTYYELSGLLPYNSSYIIRTIKKLEKAGMIVREKKGKKKVISLAEGGREVIEGNKAMRSDFISELKGGGVSIEELTAFFHTMEKLSSALEAEIGEEIS